MPQLDLISFFPQIFWCIILFFVFFFYFSCQIIPQIARILKFRKKKIIMLANHINEKKDNSYFLLNQYDTVLKNSFNQTFGLLKNLLIFGNDWLLTNSYKMNTTIFLKINQRFLNSNFFKDLK